MCRIFCLSILEVLNSYRHATNLSPSPHLPERDPPSEVLFSCLTIHWPPFDESKRSDSQRHLGLFYIGRGQCETTVQAFETSEIGLRLVAVRCAFVMSISTQNL
jgi:hypothetical protein